MATHIQPPELIPATDQNWKKGDALAPVTPLSLMQIALERGQVEQLQILQDMHFKQMARDAEIEFNEAMNAVQMELGRVAPNLTNPQTRSKYASYDKLDAALRPVYTRHGFSLSFSTDPSIAPEMEMVRVICFVSRGSHTRTYHYDMPADGKGAKGGDVMTKTHARAGAGSYGMRYLLKMIFNIAIGEDDTDGNGTQTPAVDYDELQDRLKYFESCHTLAELEEHWRNSYQWARTQKDQKAIDAINTCKNARKVQLAKGGAR